MSYRISLVIYLVFSSLTLWGHNAQRENEKIVLAHLNASNKIIANAPEVIAGYQDGKLYLDEGQIYETSSGSFLRELNGEILSIPVLLKDSMGSYLTTLSMVNSKFFKNVCKDCGREWSGGVFDIWCPTCGSTNWITVRDRG